MLVWLRIPAPPLTLASPSLLQLWKEENGAVKPLQRVPPQAQAAAQKTIRSLVRSAAADTKQSVSCMLPCCLEFA